MLVDAGDELAGPAAGGDQVGVGRLLTDQLFRPSLFGRFAMLLKILSAAVLTLSLAWIAVGDQAPEKPWVKTPLPAHFDKLNLTAAQADQIRERTWITAEHVARDLKMIANNRAMEKELIYKILTEGQRNQLKKLIADSKKAPPK